MSSEPSATVTSEADTVSGSPKSDHNRPDDQPCPSSSTNVPPVPSAKQPRHRQTQMASFIHKRVTPKLQQQIDEKLLKLFTNSYQPFRLVEEPSFRQFVAALNPTYKIPSRHSISKTLIPAMYEQCLYDTREILKKAKKICVTTDCWTSINMESYMATTVHFLDDNFKLISLLLECSSLSVHHTAKNLANELKKVLTEYGVHDKILMVVSDNAANIKAAVKNELQWKHLGCFAHTINLVVNDGLQEEEVRRNISKVKHIVGYFKRSHIATSKLLVYQQNQGAGNPLKLLQDVPTRWNSTFYMLDRFIRLQDAIKATVALSNLDGSYTLTVDEWEIIRQLCQVLKPFEEVTKTISGEAYLTASLVIPLVNGLDSVYTIFAEKPFVQCIKNVVILFQNSLKERLGSLENSNTLSISSFLDPRFKQIGFRDPKNAEMAKKNVISLVAEKFIAKENLNNNTVTENISISQSTATENNEKNDNSDTYNIWAEFDKTAAQFQPRGTATSKAILEVQRYLECDRLLRKEDPLKWWRENKYFFPQLALVAQERLSAIATSVPCERLFSKAGLILSDRRSRLSSNKTKMLLFLNSNLTE